MIVTSTYSMQLCITFSRQKNIVASESHRCLFHRYLIVIVVARNTNNMVATYVVHKYHKDRRNFNLKIFIVA